MIELFRDISLLNILLFSFSVTGTLLFVAYSVFILWSATGCRRGIKTGVCQGIDGADREYPFISVIVAIRNEERALPGLLQALFGQDYPTDRFEVLISDDYSEDAGLPVIRSFLSNHPEFPLRLIVPEPGMVNDTGKKAALTRAMHAVRGDIILCTDGDTRPAAGWISSMAVPFEDHEIMMALGPVFYPEEGNFLRRIQAVEYLGVMGVTAGTAFRGFPVTANGGNLAFRRHCFGESGGYSSGLSFASGDDQFLLMAVRKRYGKSAVGFVFNRDAIVETPAESGVRQFLDQRIRWVSKSRGYRDCHVIAAGVVTFLPMIWILAAGLISVFTLSPAWIAATAGMVLWKGIVDLFPTRIMYRFRGITGGLWFFIPAVLFQLTYVPVVAVLAMFGPVKWKGRRVL